MNKFFSPWYLFFFFSFLYSGPRFLSVLLFVHHESKIVMPVLYKSPVFTERCWKAFDAGSFSLDPLFSFLDILEFFICEADEKLCTVHTRAKIGYVSSVKVLGRVLQTQHTSRLARAPRPLSRSSTSRAHSRLTSWLASCRPLPSS
jgi:hypothetical protein